MLTFGFNHDAAERSYLKAAQIDPDCAMCWWGASLVLGPHVNAQMDPADNAEGMGATAASRVVGTLERLDRERAFIQRARIALCGKPAGRIVAHSTKRMRSRPARS